MGDNLRDFELLSAAADILAVPHGLLVLGDDTAYCAGCGAHLAHLRRGETLAWWGRGTDSCADECPYQLSEGGGGPSPSPADGGAARGAAGSLADVADTCQGPGSGGSAIGAPVQRSPGGFLLELAGFIDSNPEAWIGLL